MNKGEKAYNSLLSRYEKKLTELRNFKKSLMTLKTELVKAVSILNQITLNLIEVLVETRTYQLQAIWLIVIMVVTDMKQRRLNDQRNRN